MGNRNKINLALWGMFLALFICTPAAALVDWDIYTIGDGSNPQIYGKKIVWQNSAGDILLYDASDPDPWAEPINSESHDNSNPQIYGNYICWEGIDNDDGVHKVFLYEGVEETPLDMLDGVFVHDPFDSPSLAPQVSDELVVWYAFDGSNHEIYTYDISTGATDKLINDGYNNRNPQVSGYNLTWEGNNFPYYVSLFFYNALDEEIVNVREVEGADNWHPQIYDDTIAWWGGFDYGDPNWYKLELFKFDVSDDPGPVKLTTDYASTTVVYPQIWGENITWEGLDRETIDFYDGSGITHISYIPETCLFNKCPQIWGNKVVWERFGTDYEYEICFWDGDTGEKCNLSYNTINDQAPQIYNCDVVWHTDDGRIFFAEAIVEADITVSPPAYDFGGVWVGYTATKTFTISNDGGEDLQISDIYLASDWTLGRKSRFSIIEAPTVPLILEPGQNVQCIIELDPFAIEFYEDTLIIESDDPDESIVEVPLTGAGEIHIDIEVDPEEFDFGEVQLNKPEITTLIIYNAGNFPIDVNSIEFTEESSTDFSIASISEPNMPFTLFTRGKKSRAEVEIEFRPTTPGLHEAILEIGNSVEGENPLEVPLSGTGI